MKKRKIPHCQKIPKYIETEETLIPLTHIYMTTHFPGLVKSDYYIKKILTKYL